VLDEAYLLVGVGPLRSERAAEFMRTQVPGVVIPDEVVERLRKTPKEKKREEGKRICVEIIQEVREIEGVAGVHLMAFKQEKLVAEIIEEAGLLPRPRQISAAGQDPLRQERKWPRQGEGQDNGEDSGK
jgi:methylenetetrahydrofolate reductase (NADPH)